MVTLAGHTPPHWEQSCRGADGGRGAKNSATRSGVPPRVPRRFSGCEVGATPEAHSPSFSEAPLLGIPMLSYKSDCVVYYKRFPPRATPNGSMTPKEGGLVISPRPKLVPSYTSIWQCGKCVCRLISNLKSGGWPPGRLLPYADRYTGAGTGSRCRSVTGSHSYRGDYL